MLIRRYEMPWRTAYEGYASAVWAAGALFFGYASVVAVGPRNLFIPLFLVCLAFCVYRLNAALRILRLRASLAGKSMSAIDSRRMRKLCKDPERVFLGFGFYWEPKHSQRLYELSKVNVPDFLVSRLLQRLFGYASEAQPATEVGAPFIHGVEPREHALYCPLDNLQGGTCIVGTTQSGKGVCMSVLAAQAIYRGDVVIILDPKNSSRLKTNVIAACQDAGREPPLDFHPAFPERGIRLDPLFNWQKGTELASRIQSIMPPNTDGAFGAFAWNAVNVVVQGLLEIEDRPNLRKITHYVRSGIEGVLQPLLEKFFQAEAPVNWREQARRYARDAREGKIRRPSESTTDELISFVCYYEKEVSQTRRSQAIDALIAVFRHNRDHYTKITANLLPVLDALTSGALGKSLSPDPFDPDDTRPIMNLEKAVRGGHVLYVALDALPDPAVASAIGAIILADLAALAGMRYNLRHQSRRISLFVDEVSNVINQPLIEILNKGAESGVQATCAMQTIADLARRLGSEDAARMALGNLNTVIALRTKDQPTQNYIVETFGKTYIHDVSVAYATRFDDHLPDFSAGVSRSLSQRREEIVPADVLNRLPNLQFFGSISGGRIIKGRVPILNKAPA